MKGKILVKPTNRSDKKLWLPVCFLNVDLMTLSFLKTAYQFTNQSTQEFEFKNKTQFFDMLNCKQRQRTLEIIEFLKKNGFLEIREGKYIFKRIEATSNNLIPADIRYVQLLKGSVLRVYLYLCHIPNYSIVTTENITKTAKISRKVCYKALDELLKRKILKVEGETVRLTDYNEFVNETIGDVLEGDLETKQNAILKEQIDYARSVKK